MTITLARPTTDEILLDAATTPTRATMHTSKIAARNLRHGSLFTMLPDGCLYRALGTPRHITVDGVAWVELDLVCAGGLPYGPARFGLNEAVHGVVGAI